MKTLNRKLIFSALLGATLAPLIIAGLAGCSGGSNDKIPEGTAKGDTIVNRKEIGVTTKGKQVKERMESQ